MFLKYLPVFCWQAKATTCCGLPHAM